MSSNVERLTILYAEDHTATASRLKTSLEEVGNFEVVIAADGLDCPGIRWCSYFYIK